jgi:hypothetical protein
MTLAKMIAASSLTLTLASSAAFAGIADPDCTAEKAAKGAVAKSTVGVGGRCSAAEAAKDTGKKAAGVEDKGAIEKRKSDTPTEKARDAVKKDN